MSTQAEQPMVSVEAIRESPLGADLSESQCLLLAAEIGFNGLMLVALICYLLLPAIGLQRVRGRAE